MEQTELVVRDAFHGRHRARLLVALAIPAAVLACSGGNDSGSPVPTVAAQAPSTVAPPPTTADDAGSVDGSVLEAPGGDAFFVPPDPIPGTSNGDLIWSRPLAGAPLGSLGWQVLYRSENVRGQPIAVSGVVIAPEGGAPTARTVLTYGHGTTGLGDQCAPSRSFGRGGSETLLAIGVVALGHTFVATDYEGLGTPGVHPFLVGQSSARGMLDIVRAARQLDGSGVDSSSPVVIFGHSQGGHAALIAGELAASYAPDLDVVGTVAGAPPGDVATIVRSTAGTEAVAAGFRLMIDAGYAAAYPDLPIEALVTADGIGVLAEVAGECTGGAFALAESSSGIHLDPTVDPGWAAAFHANSPGNVAPSAPVLIIHGSADDVVPAALSETIADRYCALGATVQRIVYAGADHSTVISEGLGTAQAWLTDRLARRPAPSSC